MKKFATFISRVFDPFLVMTAVAIIAIRRSTLTAHAQIIFFIAAVLLMIGIPALLLVVSVKKKWVSDWDISVRSERPRAFLILLAIEIVSLLILHPLTDSFLSSFIVLLLAWIVGFSSITHFWKISGHSGIAGLGTGLIVAWLGFGFWPVLLIVPLVAWSRVVRRDHTLWQVIAGAVYSWSLVLLYSKYI